MLNIFGNPCTDQDLYEKSTSLFFELKNKKDQRIHEIYKWRQETATIHAIIDADHRDDRGGVQNDQPPLFIQFLFTMITWSWLKDRDLNDKCMLYKQTPCHVPMSISINSCFRVISDAIIIDIVCCISRSIFWYYSNFYKI